MHEPCAHFETDGGTEQTFRQDHILVEQRGNRDNKGWAFTKEITYSDVVFIPDTCLFEPSVRWNEEHGENRMDNNQLEHRYHPDACNPLS